METVNLSSFVLVVSLLIRFRHSCDYESNLYVDDINITSVMGVNEIDISSAISVYPNPSSGSINVIVGTEDDKATEIKIVNMLGETVAQIKSGLSLQKKFSFNLENSSKGIYFLKVKTDSGAAVKKIIIQ